MDPGEGYDTTPRRTSTHIKQSLDNTALLIPTRDTRYNSIARMLADGRFVSNQDGIFSYFMAPKKERQPPTEAALQQWRKDCMDIPRQMKAQACQHKTARGAEDGLFVILRSAPTSLAPDWREAVDNFCHESNILTIDWDSDHDHLIKDFDQAVSDKVGQSRAEAYTNDRKAAVAAVDHDETLDDIDELLAVPPPLDTVIFIKGYLKAGKQLSTVHVGAVLEKPAKNGSFIETVVQGLPGRCCGYGKASHCVRVVAQVDMAEEYCEYWDTRSSQATPSNSKRAEGGRTDETSAFYTPKCPVR